jgi:hypothetical protein
LCIRLGNGIAPHAEDVAESGEAPSYSGSG